MFQLHRRSACIGARLCKVARIKPVFITHAAPTTQFARHHSQRQPSHEVPKDPQAPMEAQTSSNFVPASRNHIQDLHPLSSITWFRAVSQSCTAPDCSDLRIMARDSPPNPTIVGQHQPPVRCRIAGRNFEAMVLAGGQSPLELPSDLH